MSWAASPADKFFDRLWFYSLKVHLYAIELMLSITQWSRSSLFKRQIIFIAVIKEIFMIIVHSVLHTSTRFFVQHQFVACGVTLCTIRIKDIYFWVKQLKINEQLTISHFVENYHSYRLKDALWALRICCSFALKACQIWEKEVWVLLMIAKAWAIATVFLIWVSSQSVEKILETDLCLNCVKTEWELCWENECRIEHHWRWDHNKLQRVRNIPSSCLLFRIYCKVRR